MRNIKNVLRSVFPFFVRKSKENNYSIGLLGRKVDLNYDYKFLGDDPAIIYDLIDGKSSFSKNLLKMNKPLMIIGQGALRGNKGECRLYTIYSYTI